MSQPQDRRVYPMAPLIRFTLLALYSALVLPLPVLAPPDTRLAMVIALLLGGGIVVAITSERVVVDGQGIEVGYPRAWSWLLRRGWSLPWERIGGLTPVATSQGGRVYYVRCQSDSSKSQGAQAYLLPQRVAGFEDFLKQFTRGTGIRTEGIERITPPWTYRLLAVLSGLLLGGELVAWLLAGPG